MYFFRQLAAFFSDSVIFSRGRKLWIENQSNWNLQLTKLDKLMAGSYIILHDYAHNRFPPTFSDQQQTYDAEIKFRFSLPGQDVETVAGMLMRKPFWSSKEMRIYLNSLVALIELFEHLGICPPQKIVELGCGTGWMAEFLALRGFHVVGTTISPDDIKDARTRIVALEAKQLKASLFFRVAPMETVQYAVEDHLPVDAVFVFEALHHAYNWKKAISASYDCLKQGGWLVIANEPNILHTYISYRVAKLSNTHEIGFSRKELVEHLKLVGFVNIGIPKNYWSFGLKSHWIIAQKT